MSDRRHLILCGGARAEQAGDRDVVRLQLNGPDANVTLLLQDISRRLVVNIPDILFDLLEIAAYVYAADTAVSRGGLVGRKMGVDWRRSFDFVIPVRCPEIWNQERLAALLRATLSDLSEDDFRFRFVPLQRVSKIADYLEFGDDDEAGFAPDDVILFSGGLDSLAGTIEALESGQRSVVLVSHRFGGAIERAQKELVDDLRGKFGADRIFHVPVLVTVARGVNKEATHRTRAFLFAALGAVLARLFRLDGIKLFENGIISFHLPLSPQVIGARATRTTHPKVLAGYNSIFSALFAKPFKVDNPFVWQTKAEILKRMAERGHGGLIRYSRSCAHIREMTTMHLHCGRCSQCIDRRFAVLAADHRR
jgi:7-cyano-7-deazaguanine synthase in queuosine biosynthesis